MRLNNLGGKTIPEEMLQTLGGSVFAALAGQEGSHAAPEVLAGAAGEALETESMKRP